MVALLPSSYDVAHQRSSGACGPRAAVATILLIVTELGPWVVAIKLRKRACAHLSRPKGQNDAEACDAQADLTTLHL